MNQKMKNTNSTKATPVQVLMSSSVISSSELVRREEFAAMPEARGMTLTLELERRGGVYESERVVVRVEVEGVERVERVEVELELELDELLDEL